MMSENIHSIPAVAQNSALPSMVRFFFLLSGKRASIRSLLNEHLLSVPLVRATLTHLQAIQSGSKVSSSGEHGGHAHITLPIICRSLIPGF